jgi:hypothetical protein
MSHATTSPPTTNTATPATRTPTTARVLGRWMISFTGFPLGGLAALVLTDPVDSVSHAVVGGLITGVVLGAVQAWSLRLSRRSFLAWTLATAFGLAAGLTLGASLVDFGTGMGDLALQGAVTGALVEVAQAAALWPRSGFLALVWPLYLAGAYALGWVVTTAGGIAVEKQFTTFGAYGAVTATLLTAVLPLFVAARPTSTEKSRS